jgi:outer membrane protein
MKKSIINYAEFLFQLLLVTTAEVKEVKTALCRYFSVDEEYTEAKDLEAKYKAQSERKTTRSRN